MTGPRLPRNLRRREAVEKAALPPYTHTPVTTPGGLTVAGWSWPPVPVFSGGPVNHDMSKAAIEDGPDIEEDDAEPGEVCEACDGWGYFTETREGSDGRDVDIDHECDRCETTGRVL